MSPTNVPLNAMRSICRYSTRINAPQAFSTRFYSHFTCSTPRRLTPSVPSRTSSRILQYRYYSSATPEDPSPTPAHAPKSKRPPQPEYEMTFTCKPCKTRSSHRVSKQGYHHGSVLITCPECKNRHVISDHLGIFTDKSLTIEDLMRERGQLVKKGTLSEDGNLEFWEDGTTTKRADRTGGTEDRTGPARLE